MQIIHDTRAYVYVCFGSCLGCIFARLLEFGTRSLGLYFAYIIANMQNDWMCQCRKEVQQVLHIITGPATNANASVSHRFSLKMSPKKNKCSLKQHNTNSRQIHCQLS